LLREVKANHQPCRPSARCISHPLFTASRSSIPRQSLAPRPQQETCLPSQAPSLIRCLTAGQNSHPACPSPSPLDIRSASNNIHPWGLLHPSHSLSHNRLTPKVSSGTDTSRPSIHQLLRADPTSRHSSCTQTLCFDLGLIADLRAVPAKSRSYMNDLLLIPSPIVTRST
jgi:hypothetical protein